MKSRDKYQKVKQIDLHIREALNNVVGTQGPPGPPGQDGYTPVKGVDYFDGDPGAPGSPGAKGDPGEPGSDATVTKSAVEAVLTGEISTHSHSGGSGLTQAQIRRIC